MEKQLTKDIVSESLEHYEYIKTQSEGEIIIKKCTYGIRTKKIHQNKTTKWSQNK